MYEKPLGLLFAFCRCLCVNECGACIFANSELFTVLKRLTDHKLQIGISN